MSLPAYGTVTRTKPRVLIHRGWDPNNPTQRSVNAPIAAGVTIRSGQVISLSSNNGVMEWVLGQPAAGDIPFIAYQDSDDFDVVASGGLTGLSSQDQIELSTPYFRATPVTVAYGKQVRLKADGVTGNVTTALTTDRQTLGFQSRYDGPHDIAAEYPGAAVDGSGHVLVLTLTTDFQRNGAEA